MDTHTPPRNRSQKLGIGGLALLACIAVALCGLAFSPRAAHAAVGDYGTLEDGTYLISSYYASTQGYSRCINVTDRGKANGTKVQTWATANGSGEECWRITTNSDGYSTIVNAQSGKALDVPGGTFNDLEQLQIYTKNGGKAQKWKIVEQATGYKILWAGDERYAIDLAYWSTDNGAMVILGGDSGNANQRWTFTKLAEDTINVSDKQTEVYNSSIFFTDRQRGTFNFVVESIPSGWKSGTTGSGVNKLSYVYYPSGVYKSGSDTIKVRYDKVGKVNGKWVSIRLTFSNLRGSNASPDVYVPSQASGCSCLKFYSGLGFWDGLLYGGLDQADMKMELLDYSTKSTISLNGSLISFGSLDYSSTWGSEGVKYVTSKNHKAYVLTSNNLIKNGSGVWISSSADGWKDEVGYVGYNKNAVGFGIVDSTPTFRFVFPNNAEAFFFRPTMSALTITAPPSPAKSATITG